MKSTTIRRTESRAPAVAVQAFTSGALKRTLVEVARDEAEAISLLVNLLERVRKTSHTAPLERICEVVNEWQHRPPRGIVTSLQEVAEEFDKCPAHGKK